MNNLEQVASNPQPLPKLWNKNFIILVLGSFVSIIGYSCATFTLGKFMLDTNNNDILLFAFSLAISMLPRLISPAIAGTYFDRHSRRKAIYTIDFMSAILFTLCAILFRFDALHIVVVYAVQFILGAQDGVYMVAFDSLFPLLVTTNTTRQAYSINSMLWPIGTVISMPLTLLGYEKIGPLTMFIVASCLLFVTACIEIFIRVREPHLMPYEPEKQLKLPKSPKQIEHENNGGTMEELIERKERNSFFTDFREGARYIKQEKGLLAITIYFFVVSLCGGAMNTLTFPYFNGMENVPLLGGTVSGLWVYLVVFGTSTIGRFIGANVQYHVKFKASIRYTVAVVVYITTNIITIALLHLPIWLMCTTMFIEGMLSVTSYNLRISSTQLYVPEEKRGRFNGAFMFFNMLGSLFGQIVAGLLGSTTLTVPIIISCVFAFNLIAVFIIVIPAQKYIKPIYNVGL